ncbi:MAG: zinc-dependent metalloprotease, partial [Bacteroidaceae bacterium]|nr:zinc-dependent metalloprotease [Bacteroidaceae bacterium]
SPFSTQIFPLRKTPFGTTEQEPAMLLKNQQNYILWDLLANDRLVRMYQNEWMNGNKAFTAVDMLDMLHNSIFRKTNAGPKLNVMERSLQKSFVDALITAAAESEGVKINKHLTEEKQVSSSGSRIVDMTMTQITRTSDALSVKRSELIRIMRLMKNRRTSGDLSTQMHYDDVVLRIQTALGLQK